MFFLVLSLCHCHEAVSVCVYIDASLCFFHANTRFFLNNVYLVPARSTRAHPIAYTDVEWDELAEKMMARTLVCVFACLGHFCTVSNIFVVFNSLCLFFFEQVCVFITFCSLLFDFLACASHRC